MYWSASVAITEYYRLGYLTNRHVFLTVLGVRSLRARCQHGWVLPWFTNFYLLAVFSHGNDRRRGRGGENAESVRVRGRGGETEEGEALWSPVMRAQKAS